MDGWLGYLLAIVALLVLAPLAAWVGRRHGKAIKGASGLAFVLLGFGHVMDPPARHLVEAVGGEEEPSDATGEPKDPTSGS
jgi:hypothetical protein